MMTSDDKMGGWVKKGQNHDDVILECPLGHFLTVNALYSDKALLLVQHWM